MVPVTFEMELSAPPIEWAIREVVPSAMPLPNYKGPWTNPSLGLSFRSLMPVEMFLNSPIGLPMMFREPNTL